MALVTLRRNPLVYPGTPAGINLNHIALTRGSACRFAGVARNGNFFDLTRGVSGTLVGTPTRVIDGNTGDSVQSSSTSNAMTFAGRATVDQRMTFGAIVRWANLGAGTYSFIFANSTNTSGYNAFFAGNNGALGIVYALNYTTLGSFVANNIPYFVAGSAGVGGSTNFVARRLDTGAITSYSAGGPGAYSDSPNGTYVVGNWPALGSFGMVGRLAAVAYTNAYLSLPQLLQWAAAPWDFWYPPTLASLVLATGAGAAPPPAARQYAVTVNS